MGVNDIVDNMGGSQQTRGLSGRATGNVVIDERNPYFNGQLRRHQTTDDITSNPGLIWATAADGDGGLSAHVTAAALSTQRNQGQDVVRLRFTDVLIVLSRDDFARIDADPAGGWIPMALRILTGEFQGFCDQHGLLYAVDERSLGFRILCDGDEELGYHEFNLKPGEFVTGLLPNLYTGPIETSRPTVALHVNLPGVWEGYQEVGQLYNDQMLFTIGNSGLDNFSHPSLRESALYRLRLSSSGQLIHIISPDLQDEYQLTTSEQDGTSIVTLATVQGEPLAYIVLAEPEYVDEGPEQSGEEFGDWDAQEEAEVPLSADPAMRTIMPELPEERILTLQERGVLFQRVHFKSFMDGYDVYLGPRGELGTSVESPAATFQVRRKGIFLIAHTADVSLNGVLVTHQSPFQLTENCTIEVSDQSLDFRYLKGIKADKWPYVAEIRRPASSNYMMWGDRWSIGRAEDARVVLPDEPENDNIHWKADVEDGAYIRSRNGDIEKSRFYTDSIMVASHHADIDLTSDSPTVVCVAKHCFVYVRRGRAVFPLYPSASGKFPQEMPIESGDEVLIGNSVFQVSFGSGEAVAVAPAPAPAPAPTLQADASSLAANTFSEFNPDISPNMPIDDPELSWDAPADSEPEAAPEPEATDGFVESFDLDAFDESLDDDDGVFDPPGTGEWQVNFEEETVTAGSHPVLDEIRAQRKAARAAEPIETAAPTTADSAMNPPNIATPPVAAPTPPPAPATPHEAASGDVAFVREEDAQFELARPVRLVQIGWMVSGTVRLGNHYGCDLVLPENQLEDDQTFPQRDYVDLKVRGRKSALTPISASELAYNGSPLDAPQSDIEGQTIGIMRRDDAGDEDFWVHAQLVADASLPNPRARLLRLDTSDKLSAALVTRGLAAGQSRTLRPGEIAFEAATDGSTVSISNYLDTYRAPDGTYRSFFYKTSGTDFRTAPEDGQAFQLGAGDQMIVGHAVFSVEIG